MKRQLSASREVAGQVAKVEVTDREGGRNEAVLDCVRNAPETLTYTQHTCCMGLCPVCRRLPLRAELQVTSYKDMALGDQRAG